MTFEVLFGKPYTDDVCIGIIVTGTELGNISRTEVDLGKKGYSTVFFVPPQLIFFLESPIQMISVLV